jgi:predicted MFS family arabinose efflux permease
MALVLTGTPIATVATIPLATYLAGQFGWQASFGVQAAVSAGALLGIWWGLPALPVRAKKDHRQQLRLLANGRFLVSCGMNFLLVAAWFSTYSYFADYLGTGHGVSPKMVSYLLLVFGVAGVLGNWLAGKLLSRSIPLTTAFFLAGTVLLPFGFRYAPVSLPSTLGLVALWGLLYGPAFLTASAYLISAAPGALELANSLSTSCGNLGVAIGTLLSGWFIATHGIGVAPWVGAAFGLGALALLGLRNGLETAARNRLARPITSSDAHCLAIVPERAALRPIASERSA